MSRRPQTHLLLSVIIALACSSIALELPYEVLDSIIELNDLDPDFAGLTQVNVSDDLGPSRPLYRLDLDSDYVAYYEIDTGSEYVVLSSGSKTGDYREVESGPDPRPTDVLIKQARENGQRCEKFYRLSPMGLTVCKNDNGTVVAANYNWTAAIAKIKDWRKLDQMVKQGLDGFKSQWRERAAKRRTRTDWATLDVVLKAGKKKKTDINEEALSPGSIVKLALGERFKSVSVDIRNGGSPRMRPGSNAEWQKKLCKVLVDVCMPKGGTKVAPSAIQETPNHLLYLKLEVHDNRTFVGNVLQWREIGFVVKIYGRKNEVIKKHFAINLHSKRFRRSSGSSYRRGSIQSESNFPKYYQHDCCGCVSGCSPVAWAQVFKYYDRHASLYSNSIFSPRIYGDSSTMAPLSMTSGVKSFVEDIRTQLKTSCKNGEGLTYRSDMNLVAPWFRARQGSKARVVSYFPSRKKRGTGGSGAGVQHGDSSWIISKAIEDLNLGYPVIFSITLDNGGGHSVVATQYKKYSRRYRACQPTAIGFFWGQTSVEVCSWKTAYGYEFFLHYGWESDDDKFLEVSPEAAYNAYIAK